MAWEKRMAASPRRGWNPAHRRLAVLTLAYAGCMAYSLFLAGAAQRIPTIWTANAVLIAGLLLLNRRQGAALLGLTAVLHVAMELAVGDPPRFVLTGHRAGRPADRRRRPCCG
jgi:hypothetical protein